MAKRPSWVNTSLDVLEFHDKKIKEFGQTPDGRPSGSREGWSIRDTANAFEISIGKAHNLINVARALKRNSLISHATSFNAAIKLARK